MATLGEINERLKVPSLAEYESMPRYKKAVTPYPEEYYTMTKDERNQLLENNILRDNTQELTTAQKLALAAQKNKPGYQELTDSERNMLKINGINPDAAFKNSTTQTKTPKSKNNGGGGSRTSSRTWNAKAVRQPEPTYVDQDGVTHTGMTQDEFNQSMKMYEADNQGWYEHQRNQTLPGGSTRGEIFDQAVEKFLANPDSFNDSQKQALIKVGQQLGYFNGSSTAAPDQTETQTVTDTVTTAPTVQPTVTPTPTQRQVNSAHDAYYAPQNSQWGITL